MPFGVAARRAVRSASPAPASGSSVAVVRAASGVGACGAVAAPAVAAGPPGCRAVRARVAERHLRRTDDHARAPGAAVLLPGAGGARRRGGLPALRHRVAAAGARRGLRVRRLGGGLARGTAVAQKIDAVDQFHGEEQALRVLIQLVQPHQVGVEQPLQRAELALEAQQRLGRSGEQPLAREPLAPHRVLYQLHRAHAAAPERAEGAVPSVLLAHRGRPRRETAPPAG
ncbi:MAG: hypothetical protein KatS3mg102_2911 [Planctomycetota bacterium]|nr:MAG: hypothetical protein KatS3mg102_2911 [Planctomycetota bacterium]